MVITLDGKILHRAPMVNFLKGERKRWTGVLVLKALKADSESSHFNSFYEIPENDLSAKVDWLKPGNLIVNSLVLGVLVFDTTLSKVLHRFVHKGSHWHSVHDVQVTSSGEILLFNNHVAENGYRGFQQFRNSIRSQRKRLLSSPLSQKKCSTLPPPEASRRSVITYFSVTLSPAGTCTLLEKKNFSGRGQGFLETLFVIRKSSS